MSVTDIPQNVPSKGELPPYADYTPKQRKNWEEYGQDRIEVVREVAENLYESDESHVDPETCVWWYLRLYRPKKRGDGLMKTDRVKTGNPEKFVEAVIDKFHNPMKNMFGLMMHSFGLSEERREELTDIGVTIATAQALWSDNRRALTRLFEEHKRVGKLYGIDPDD